MHVVSLVLTRVTICITILFQYNSNLVKYGTLTFPTYNTSVEIDLGFKPSIITVMVHKGNNTVYIIYDTKHGIYLRGFTVYSEVWGFGENALNGDIEITDSGFKVLNKISSVADIDGCTARYYAMC